jgi:plastocyanin
MEKNAMKPAYLVVPATLALSTAAIVPVAGGAAHRPQAHAAKTRVAVAAKEFKFTLRPTSARHGSVTFAIANVGKVQHDFKIAGRTTPKINPRKSRTLTVNLKKGTYHYLCTVPGHAASGMKGTFRVS